MSKAAIILTIFPLWLFSQKPNVILIFSDDQGVGEISRNGTTYDTPEIDLLADNGVYFNHYLVERICTPSRAALMSGQYSHKVDLGIGVIWPWEDRRIADSVNVLPKLMKEQGYTTGIIGKWHLGHTYPEMLPHVQGWDYSLCNYLGDVEDYDTYTAYESGYDFHENGSRFDTAGYLTEIQGAKAVQWIEQVTRCSNQPFFLYVPFQAPHTPMDAPAAKIAEAPGVLDATQKIRWAMLKIMDEQIGLIVDAVEAAGVDSNTVIIFLSDNGAPGPPDQSYVGGDNGPWSRNKGRLREGGVRVPFIWYQPGTAPPGAEVDSLCHLVDLVPTLVEGVAGGNIGTVRSAALDGYNFYNLVGGDSGNYPANRKVLVGMTDTTRWAVSQGRWKLHNNLDSLLDGTGYSHNLTLYDLQADSLETTDVSATYPDKVAELREFAESYYSTLREQDYTNSRPGGWISPTIWGDPKTFYDPNYQYYRAP